MDRYAASGTLTAVAASPGKTALVVLASPNTRAKIHYIEFGVGGTPADNVLEWLVRRITADGTGTPVTPSLLDPGAPAAQLSAKYNYTVEPTFGVTLMDFQIHQRAGKTWIAPPGGELVIPVTAGAGIAFTPIHASYTGPATVIVHWLE